MPTVFREVIAENSCGPLELLTIGFGFTLFISCELKLFLKGAEAEHTLNLYTTGNSLASVYVVKLF